MEKDEINLGQFGLSAEESRVYLMLIKLGPSAVYDIAHHISMSRSAAYYHLESLIDKGLVSISFANKKNIYSPAKPKVLENILREKEAELLKQKNKLPKLLDKIIQLQKTSAGDPEAKIAKGKNGILEVMNDVLESKEDIYFIGSHDVVLEKENIVSTSFFLRNFTAKRRQKGKTKAYIISDFSKLSLRQMKEEDTDFRQIKIWPKLQGINGGLVVYGSKVSVYTVNDDVTVFTINNEINAALLRLVLLQLFDNLD